MQISEQLLPLITLVLGAVLSQGGSWLQGRWQRKHDQQRAIDERNHKDYQTRADRMRSACEQILDHAFRLKIVIHDTRLEKAYQARDVQPSLEQILRQSILLPEATERETLSSLVDII